MLALQPTITNIKAKKLVGQSVRMSMNANKTGELWRSFMPRRKEINHKVTDHLYSLQVYPSNYFERFNPAVEFVKWALVEVTGDDEIPSGMESFEIDAGQYAVFHYRGPANDPRIFQYIFTEWLPASGYALDHRPHFEVLGDQYKNDSPDSEEEIWIPVKAASV